MYDTISIQVNKGSIANGKFGKNNLNQWNPFLDIAKIVMLSITPQPNEKVWKMWLVTVKLNGTMPMKFETKINKNNAMKKIKCRWPFQLTCAKPVCDIKLYKNSNLPWDKSGTSLPKKREI